MEQFLLPLRGAGMLAKWSWAWRPCTRWSGFELALTIERRSSFRVSARYDEDLYYKTVRPGLGFHGDT